MADFHDDYLYIKGVPVLAVVDTKNCFWYKGVDVASALGYANASYLINKHVSPKDKSPFKDIQIQSQTPISVDKRNIFVNISGLKSILSSCGSKDVLIKKYSIEQKPVPGAQQNVPKYEQNRFSITLNNGRLQINDCPILHVVDCDGVKWFKANDIAGAVNVKNTSFALSKHVDPGDRMALTQINATSLEADPRCIFINSNGLKSFLSAFHQTESASRLRALEKHLTPLKTSIKTKASIKSPEVTSQGTNAETAKYIVIKSVVSARGHEISELSLKKLNSLEGVEWKIECSRKLYDTIVFLLSPWYDSKTKLYNKCPSKLVEVVSQMCNSFKVTQMFVDRLLKNKAPVGSITRRLSDDEVRSMADKIDDSGRLGWIYIASNDRYATRNIFKVGSTTRVTRRLNPYNTGRIEEDFLHYYWARRVFDCQKIDGLIQYFLNEQSQKIKRPTEMYTIDFQLLKNIVIKIIQFYETSLDAVANG